MSERAFSSDVMEHDGDVISRADADSIQGVLPEELQNDSEDWSGYEVSAEVAEELAPPATIAVIEERDARQAAAIEEQYTAAFMARAAATAERDAASIRYDEFFEGVQHRVDQGVDETHAWEELDAHGEVRGRYNAAAEAGDRAQKLLDAIAQTKLNHEEIRKRRHERYVDEWNKIVQQTTDPQQRERTWNAYVAKERARQERQEKGFLS